MKAVVSLPLLFRMWATIAVVVVLPWVPATAMVKWFSEILPKASERFIILTLRCLRTSNSLRSFGTAGV